MYRQLHRRFYFPSATPQLRVSQPQNVSSPSLYSPVKLDFIGLLSILRSRARARSLAPRKYFRPKQSRHRPPPHRAPGQNSSPLRQGVRAAGVGAVRARRETKAQLPIVNSVFNIFFFLFSPLRASPVYLSL